MTKTQVVLAVTVFGFGLLMPSMPEPRAECDPCDIVVRACTNNPPGNYLEVHDCPGSFVCFKFFRRECGGNAWTLIYEGPNEFFCDTEYEGNDCVQYKCQKWTSISGGSCGGTMYCETAASNCPSGC
jgi:hypothetical protein